MNSITNKIKSEKKTILKIIFIIIFVIIWTALFIRCKYGYASLDETFYIQLIQRIAQGDALIAEEWHPSQLFSFIMFPFFILYNLLFSSFMSIVLYFRYLYVFVLGISCLFIFNLLKKITFFGAAISSILLLLYAPNCITALYYNTICIICLALMFAINATKNTKLANIISGSLYSFSVLCCPFLVILILYFILYFIFIKKDKKQLAFFALGVLIWFAIFCIFVLSKTSISSIIKSIPNILSNPEYNNIELITKTKDWIRSILVKNSIVFILSILTIIIISFFLKKKHVCILLSFIAVSILIIFIYKKYYYINHLMYPLAIVGPILFLIDDKNIRNVMFSIWIPGIIYSFCINMASDQVEYAIYSALCISSVASICGFSIYINGLDKEIAIFVQTAFCILLSLLLVLVARIRWNQIYSDTNIKDQTIKLDSGPEKGIYVTEEKRHIYDIVMTANETFMFDGKTILFLTNEPLYYIINNQIKSSAYSSWMVPSSYLQLNYFEINPHKIPDLIFYPSIEMGKYDEVLNALIDKYGYKIDDWNDCGMVFKR